MSFTRHFNRIQHKNTQKAQNELTKLGFKEGFFDGTPEESGIPVDHLKLPVGQVVSDPIKGEFLALPVFGWVCRRVKVHTPLVMLILILIDPSAEDPTPKGTLRLELPVFPDTELATLGLLEAFGWDGRLWPDDEGWPNGDSDAETNLKALMAQAQVSATLTFPPYDSGCSAQKVNISRAQGPFLMPPIEPYEGDPDPERLAKFRHLCENSAFLFLRRAN